MLGSLAKKLRLLGFDTAYLGHAEDSEREYVIRSQGRILLTKDETLVKKLDDLAWTVTGADVKEEFLSIADSLSDAGCRPYPFSLCLECNAKLESLEPSRAEGKVPPYIFQSKDSFSSCPACGKVFWEGTHSERMEGEVKWMAGILKGAGRSQDL